MATGSRAYSRTDMLAVIVVIGLQLLPSDAVERVQWRIERLRPIPLAVGLAVSVVRRRVTDSISRLSALMTPVVSV